MDDLPSVGPLGDGPCRWRLPKVPRSETCALVEMFISAVSVGLFGRQHVTHHATDTLSYPIVVASGCSAQLVKLSAGSAAFRLRCEHKKATIFQIHFLAFSIFRTLRTLFATHNSRYMQTNHHQSRVRRRLIY